MAITKLVITGNTTAVGISSTPIEVSLAHTAKSTSVDPNDNITTTNVQSALEELDDIKVDVTDGLLTDPTISGTATVANLDVSGNTEFTGFTTLNQCLINGQTALNTDGGVTPLILTKSYPSPGNEAGKLFVNDTDLVITSTQDDDFGGFVFKTEHALTNTLTRATLSGNGDIGFYESTGTDVKFFWDSSAASLGLATLTPENTLTVGNTESSTVSQDATVGIKCDGNDKGIMLQENGGSEQWAIGVNADGDLNFYDSDTADPVIVVKDETTNVGIATNTPHHKLHVHGGDIMISSDTGTSTGDGKPALLFSEENPSNTDSDDAKAGIIYDGDGQSDDANYLGLGVWDTSQDDQDTLAEQKATTTLNITRDNKVGIGTNTPDSILHCKGSVNSNLDLTVTNEFDDDNDDAPNPTARLLLSAAGNDGYLEVHGSPDDDIDLRYLDLGTTQPASNLTFSPVGNEAMRIRSGGYVMIGTTVASAMLHVADPDSSGTNKRLFRVSNSANGNLTIECDDLASANPVWSLKYKTGNALAFGDNNNEYMRITSEGKVGINTENPTGEFTVGTDVGESAAQTVFYGQNNADNTSSIALSTSHTPRIGTIHSNSYYDNAGTLSKTDATMTSTEITMFQDTFANADHGNFIFGGTSANSTVLNESMRISSAGNVGINTTGASRKLHVKENGYHDTFCIENDNGTRLADFGWHYDDFALTLDHEDATFSVRRQTSNANIIYTNLQVNADGTTILSAFNTSDNALIVENSARIYSPVHTSTLEFSSGQGTVEILAPRTDRSLVLRTTTDQYDSIKLNANGKLTVPSGIRLGTGLNDTSTDNVLNDYEIGTWTPNLYGSNNSSTSLSYSSAATQYTKVGRLVYFNAYITNVVATNQTLTGEFRISGLPFTAGRHAPITISYTDLFTFDEADRSVSGYVSNGSTYISVRKGSSKTAVLMTEITNNSISDFMISGSYTTL